MLAKSFTDDLAWEVQKKLVSSYFNVYFGCDLNIVAEYEIRYCA